MKNNDIIATTETLPENMPQLEQLEQCFADFLKQYDLFIDSYLKKKELEEQSSLDQTLANLSDERITIKTDNSKNSEGMLCFKNNETGDEIEFRTGGTNGNHTYLKDENGVEQLFLWQLDPEKKLGISSTTLTRMQGGKKVSSIGNNGIDVNYQTEEDKKRRSEACDRHYPILKELIKTKSNIFKALLNRGKIKNLESSLQENPDPYAEKNKEAFMTKKTIPVSESEAIFERFNKIITATTAALKKYGSV